MKDLIGQPDWNMEQTSVINAVDVEPLRIQTHLSENLSEIDMVRACVAFPRELLRCLRLS